MSKNHYEVLRVKEILSLGLMTIRYIKYDARGNPDYISIRIYIENTKQTFSQIIFGSHMFSAYDEKGEINPKFKKVLINTLNLLKRIDPELKILKRLLNFIKSYKDK